MNHLKQMEALLDEYGIDAMLVTSKPGEGYAVGFYGEGIAVVTRGKHYYLTDSRYVEAAEKVVEGAAVLSSSPGNPHRKLLRDILAADGIRRLGYEDGYMTVAAQTGYAQTLPCELVPAQKLLSTLRASKGADEIAVMERAQRIAERAFDEILAFIRPGLREREIAAKLVYDMLRFGAEKPSFDTIVVSGPNSSLPHGVPGDRQVAAGDFVTMDFGCRVEGYCSDMTRTVAVGHVTDEMRKVYEIVLEAQLTGISAARAGVTGKSIDAAARGVIEKAGYGEYFGHSFGHSLGLEIHESPNASAAETGPMPAGAVISAEPGIYLPGRFGVRIEDVLILQETGSTNLTRSPKELIIL